MRFFSDFGGVALQVETDGEATGFVLSTPGVANTNVGPNTIIAGGALPIAVVWSYVSGAAGITIDNANAVNPVWSASFDMNGVQSAFWRITVTDAAANVVTDDVLVRLEAF